MLVGLSCLSVSAQETGSEVFMLWAKRVYGGWDNPLHSEFSVNDKIVPHQDAHYLAGQRLDGSEVNPILKQVSGNGMP
jgi:hypothetical protein